MSLSRLEEDNENAFLTLRSDVEGRWDDPNCARRVLNAFISTNDHSKLARYLFRDGG